VPAAERRDRGATRRRRAPARLGPRFERALAYAARLHRDQRRKGSGIPYVSHLLATAALTIEHGGDEDEAIAALLHDAVEDQGGEATRRAIRRRFGARVGAIVDECSDADTIPKPPWRERKQRYVAHLAAASPSARLVCACDKLHNALSILSDLERHGEALWDRFRGGREGTLWYYRAIADELLRAGGGTAAAALAHVVGEIEQWARTADGGRRRRRSQGPPEARHR